MNTAELEKYAPWVVGALVVLYILYKFVGGSGSAQQTIVPQAQITDTPQTDPLATLRGQAFQELAQFDLGAIQAEAGAQTSAQQTTAQSQLAQTEAQLSTQVQLASIDAGTENTSILAQAQQYANDLQYEQATYNQQSQAAALQQYYNAINQQQIIGSIGSAVGGILGSGGLGSLGSIISF